MTNLQNESGESTLDRIFAAIIISLTMAFGAFIFGLVTEFVPRIFDNIILSVSMGICSGLIAYSMMTNDI